MPTSRQADWMYSFIGIETHLPRPAGGHDEARAQRVLRG